MHFADSLHVEQIKSNYPFSQSLKTVVTQTKKSWWSHLSNESWISSELAHRLRHRDEGVEISSPRESIINSSRTITSSTSLRDASCSCFLLLEVMQHTWKIITDSSEELELTNWDDSSFWFSSLLDRGYSDSGSPMTSYQHIEKNSLQYLPSKTIYIPKDIIEIMKHLYDDGCRIEAYVNDQTGALFDSNIQYTDSITPMHVVEDMVLYTLELIKNHVQQATLLKKQPRYPQLSLYQSIPLPLFRGSSLENEANRLIQWLHSWQIGDKRAEDLNIQNSNHSSFLPAGLHAISDNSFLRICLGGFPADLWDMWCTRLKENRKPLPETILSWNWSWIISDMVESAPTEILHEAPNDKSKEPVALNGGRVWSSIKSRWVSARLIEQERQAQQQNIIQENLRRRKLRGYFGIQNSNSKFNIFDNRYVPIISNTCIGHTIPTKCPVSSKSHKILTIPRIFPPTNTKRCFSSVTSQWGFLDTSVVNTIDYHPDIEMQERRSVIQYVQTKLVEPKIYEHPSFLKVPSHLSLSSHPITKENKSIISDVFFCNDQVVKQLVPTPTEDRLDSLIEDGIENDCKSSLFDSETITKSYTILNPGGNSSTEKSSYKCTSEKLSLNPNWYKLEEKETERSSRSHSGINLSDYEQDPEIGDIESDNLKHGGGFCTNVVVLQGLHGVGKTALVYLASQLLGYRVVEINTSTKRCPQNMKEIFSELTQGSHLDSYSHKSTTSVLESYLTDMPKSSLSPSCLRSLKAKGQLEFAFERLRNRTQFFSKKPRVKRSSSMEIIEVENDLYVNEISLPPETVITRCSTLLDYFHSPKQSTLSEHSFSELTLEPNLKSSSRCTRRKISSSVDILPSERLYSTDAYPSHSLAYSQSMPSIPSDSIDHFFTHEKESPYVIFLFENADTMLEDENKKSFYSFLRQFSEKSKIPILLTVDEITEDMVAELLGKKLEDRKQVRGTSSSGRVEDSKKIWGGSAHDRDLGELGEILNQQDSHITPFTPYNATQLFGRNVGFANIGPFPFRIGFLQLVLVAAVELNIIRVSNCHIISKTPRNDIKLNHSENIEWLFLDIHHHTSFEQVDEIGEHSFKTSTGKSFPYQNKSCERCLSQQNLCIWNALLEWITKWVLSVLCGTSEVFDSHSSDDDGSTYPEENLYLRRNPHDMRAWLQCLQSKLVVLPPKIAKLIGRTSTFSGVVRFPDNSSQNPSPKFLKMENSQNFQAWGASWMDRLFTLSQRVNDNKEKIEEWNFIRSQKLLLRDIGQPPSYTGDSHKKKLTECCWCWCWCCCIPQPIRTCESINVIRDTLSVPFSCCANSLLDDAPMYRLQRVKDVMELYGKRKGPRPAEMAKNCSQWTSAALEEVYEWKSTNLFSIKGFRSLLTA